MVLGCFIGFLLYTTRKTINWSCQEFPLRKEIAWETLCFPETKPLKQKQKLAFLVLTWPAKGNTMKKIERRVALTRRKLHKPQWWQRCGKGAAFIQKNFHITIIALKSCLLANEAVNGCLWQTLVVAKVGGGKGVFSGKRVADLLPFVLVAPLPHLCH